MEDRVEGNLTRKFLKSPPRRIQKVVGVHKPRKVMVLEQPKLLRRSAGYTWCPAGKPGASQPMDTEEDVGEIQLIPGFPTDEVEMEDAPETGAYNVVADDCDEMMVDDFDHDEEAFSEEYDVMDVDYEGMAGFQESYDWLLEEVNSMPVEYLPMFGEETVSVEVLTHTEVGASVWPAQAPIAESSPSAWVSQAETSDNDFVQQEAIPADNGPASQDATTPALSVSETPLENVVPQGGSNIEECTAVVLYKPAAPVVP